MKSLNQFQLKSLCNLSFDLSKAWFIAGVITPPGLPLLSLETKITLFTIGLAACLFFIYLGLYLGKEIKNE